MDVLTIHHPVKSVSPGVRNDAEIWIWSEASPLLRYLGLNRRHHFQSSRELSCLHRVRLGSSESTPGPILAASTIANVKVFGLVHSLYPLLAEQCLQLGMSAGSSNTS